MVKNFSTRNQNALIVTELLRKKSNPIQSNSMFFIDFVLNEHIIIDLELLGTYFVNTGSSLSNKSNNNWSFTSSYKSESHCWTPIEHNQTRFRWFFIITICIGCLVCRTFILMTE